MTAWFARHPAALLAIGIFLMACSVVVFVMRRQSEKKRIFTLRGQNKNGDPSKGQVRVAPLPRQSDALKLSPAAEQTRKQSLAKIESGDAVTGAQGLLSIGLERDAISALENKGFIDEACAILLRMNRPNRAAVVYQRNDRHLPAAKYYVVAGMKAEAAECLMAAAQTDSRYLIDAAQLYVDVKNYTAAFHAFLQAQSYERVAALVMKEDLFELLRDSLSEKQLIRGVFEHFDVKSLRRIVYLMPEDLASARALALWCRTLKRIEFIELCLRRIQEVRSMAVQFWLALSDSFALQVVEAMANAPQFAKADGHKFLSKHARALLEARKFSLAAKLYLAGGRVSMGAKCLMLAGNLDGALETLALPGGDDLILEQLDHLLRPTADLRAAMGAKHTFDPVVLEKAHHMFLGIDPDNDDLQSDSPFSLIA